MLKIAAVLAPCSKSKNGSPPYQACAASIPSGSQREVEAAWLLRLYELRPRTQAGRLYAGRGFRYAARAAIKASAPLFIISAGLGLVPADEVVPVYGITVRSGGTESIRSRVEGGFDPSRWFSALCASHFSVPLARIFDQPGLVLISLSPAYAEMISPMLDSLSDAALQRVRITGLAVKSALRPRLHPLILPYDSRLDAIHSGTKMDFAGRAMLHFVERIVPELNDIASADAFVDQILSELSTPQITRLPLFEV